MARPKNSRAQDGAPTKTARQAARPSNVAAEDPDALVGSLRSCASGLPVDHFRLIAARSAPPISTSYASARTLTVAAQSSLSITHPSAL